MSVLHPTETVNQLIGGRVTSSVKTWEVGSTDLPSLMTVNVLLCSVL